MMWIVLRKARVRSDSNSGDGEIGMADLGMVGLEPGAAGGNVTVTIVEDALGNRENNQGFVE